MAVALVDAIAAVHMDITVGEGAMTIGGGLRFKSLSPLLEWVRVRRWRLLAYSARCHGDVMTPERR